MISKHDVIAAQVQSCDTWREVQDFLEDKDAGQMAAKGGDTVTYWKKNQMVAVLKTKDKFLVVRVRYADKPEQSA